MVSVIIINFNGKTLINSCLNALHKQTYANFETIIVDNGSSDDSLRIIEAFIKTVSTKFPLKIIPLNRNRGFAGGNNLGLNAASGDYVALLNNDTEPDKSWLEELVRGMEADERIGICASKLICHDSTLIDSAGDGFTKILKGFKLDEGISNSNQNVQKYVFGACAGAALYRKEMLEQIGFLDEDFFLIHEDTDLNLRAQLAGWKVLYVPTAVVHHKVRSSIGNMSDMAVYYTLRNSEFVRIKNVPFGVFLRCAFEFALGAISEFLYFAIKHKKLRLFIKAKIDAIKMFPCMWQKRRTIMKTRKVNNAYLLSLMTPIWQKDFFKAKLEKFLHG